MPSTSPLPRRNGATRLEHRVPSSTSRLSTSLLPFRESLPTPKAAPPSRSHVHRFADDSFDSHFFALRFAVGSQCPKFDSQTAMRYWVNYSLHTFLSFLPLCSRRSFVTLLTLASWWSRRTEVSLDTGKTERSFETLESLHTRRSSEANGALVAFVSLRSCKIKSNSPVRNVWCRNSSPPPPPPPHSLSLFLFTEQMLFN